MGKTVYQKPDDVGGVPLPTAASARYVLSTTEIEAYNCSRELSSKPFPSACYAGYTSMVFDPIGRVRACCVNSEHILGDIRYERIDDIWNGARLRRLRQALDRYDFRLGCRQCHHKIASGVVGLGMQANTQFQPHQYESLVIEPEAPYWPKHLEFHLSNKCNLECATCFGEYSSLIRAHRDKLRPYPLAYGDLFFADLRKYLPHLKAAQFKGGEPFLIPEMYRVWDMLIEDGLKPQCHVTTNGTIFGPEVERILESLPVSISVSIDGATAVTFESIRVNAKFDRVVRHFRRFRDLCRSRDQSIQINFTLSRLNWHEFVGVALFAEEEGVEVSVSDVYFPEHLSLYSMALDELRPIVGELEEQLARAGSNMGRNRAVLENRVLELRHHLKNVDERQSHYARSLVRPFKESLASPSTMDISAAEAIRRLKSWSMGRPIHRLDCDLDDTITHVDFDSNSILNEAGTLRGRPFGEFLDLLYKRLGSSSVQIHSDCDVAHEDRIVRFEGAGKEPTLLRAILLPRFDADDILVGASAFLATRLFDLTENMVQVLSENLKRSDA